MQSRASRLSCHRVLKWGAAALLGGIVACSQAGSAWAQCSGGGSMGGGGGGGMMGMGGGGGRGGMGGGGSGGSSGASSAVGMAQMGQQAHQAQQQAVALMMVQEEQFRRMAMEMEREELVRRQQALELRREKIMALRKNRMKDETKAVAPPYREVLAERRQQALADRESRRRVSLRNPVAGIPANNG